MWSLNCSTGGWSCLFSSIHWRLQRSTTSSLRDSQTGKVRHHTFYKPACISSCILYLAALIDLLSSSETKRNTYSKTGTVDTWVKYNMAVSQSWNLDHTWGQMQRGLDSNKNIQFLTVAQLLQMLFSVTDDDQLMNRCSKYMNNSILVTRCYKKTSSKKRGYEHVIKWM